MSTLYPTKKRIRVGPPQNPAQRQAARENFMLFQLEGAIGNLSRHCFPWGSFEALTSDHISALTAIRRAIHELKEARTHIKAAQRKRKELAK